MIFNKKFDANHIFFSFKDSLIDLVYFKLKVDINSN